MRGIAWTRSISTSGERADVLDKKSRWHFVGFHVVFTTARHSQPCTHVVVEASRRYCQISLPTPKAETVQGEKKFK